uniref:DUF1308 domain-containing protein n=1 Tax=Romanomermis culicivorax TaxID=13658 RepID=A0A915HJ82_ROMCU
MNSTCVNHELLPSLREKIGEADDLLMNDCRILLSRNISGVSKLIRKIQTERDNLIKFIENVGALTIHHLNGSNLHHYKALCGTALHYSNVISVLSPFRRSGDDKSILFVDIVADNGETWVKVVARNARGLHFSFTGESYSKEKNIVHQGIDYAKTVRSNPHHYKIPRIIFEFTGGLTEPIRAKMIKLGITVRGQVLSVESSVSDYDDSNDEDEYNEFKQIVSTLPDSLRLDDTIKNRTMSINLDITALFAFVSNLTNGYANYRFKSPMLNEQAQFERDRPALPFLNSIIEGKRLICCRTAYDAFLHILKTVGGVEERLRAEHFLKKVEIIEDACSSNVSRLQLGAKIKCRSKTIFGTGDECQAITLTANKSFVLSAESQ